MAGQRSHFETALEKKKKNKIRTSTAAVVVIINVQLAAIFQ